MSLLATLQCPSKLAYTPSVFLLMDSETLAETLCLIELEYFKSVGWQELLAYSRLGSTRTVSATPADNKSHTFHNLQAVITRFNGVCRWVTDEVQLARTPEEQASILSCLIRIAFVRFRCFAHFPSRNAWLTPTTTPSCSSSSPFSHRPWSPSSKHGHGFPPPRAPYSRIWSFLGVPGRTLRA